MHAESRVKALYFVYAAAVGLMVTWWPLRMAELGLGADTIGLLFSARTAIAFVTQQLIAWVSDRTGRPIRLVQACVLVAFALSLPIPWATSTWHFALLLWLATPFEAATTPLLDVTIVRRFGGARYGLVRAWGSAGYGVATGLLGWIAADMPPGLAGELAMIAFLIAYAGAGIFAVGIDEPAPGAARTPVRLWIAPSPALASFLAFATLHWMGIAIFNYFYALHTTALGLAVWVPGLAVAVAIAGEIAAFVVAPRLLAGLGIERVLLFAAVSTCARWVVVAVADSAAAQVLVQLTHFFSFGGYFAASMILLGRFAPAAQRGTLQGVFASVVFAGGSTLATAGGGLVLEHLGGTALFGVAAGLDAAAVLVWVLARRGWRRADATERAD